MDCYWIRNSETGLTKLQSMSKGVAVLPLASIESHGPHLPLGSDLLCLDHIVERVLEQESVAVLPILPYTFVAEARMFPGAVHIRSDLLMNLVENICDEVHRNDFDKIVMLHGHGGNVFLERGFTKRILEKEKPYAVYSVPVFAGRDEEIFALLETKEYGHACEFETSLNMVACPELVNLKSLRKKTFRSRRGPDVGCVTTPVDWFARHPEMAVGTPGKATLEKGKQVAQIWVDGIVECLRRIKKDKICRSEMAAYSRRTHSVTEKKEG